MSSTSHERGRLIVLSGPSGSGKSTIVARLLANAPRTGAPSRSQLRLAVSATTRRPREGEVEGFHYYFWTEAAFREAVRRNEFLEWAEVHGNLYGTLKSEVGPYLDQGVSVLLEIDVQGARQIRKLQPDCFMVFLRAPSTEDYNERLKARGGDNAETIQRRVNAAPEELAAAKEYDHVIVNDELDKAVTEFNKLLWGPIE